MSSTSFLNKLRFVVVSCSSEDVEHPANHLNTISCINDGWQPAQGCLYPQELGFQLLDGPALISQLQLLPLKLNTSVKFEMFIGHGNSYKTAIFTSIGYLLSDSNNSSMFKNEINITCLFIKLIIHSNKQNTDGQVAIRSVSLLGRSENNIDISAAGSNVYSIKSKATVHNDNYLSIDLNPTAKELRQLSDAKARAVNMEDYRTAKNIKLIEQEVEALGSKLAQMDMAKSDAVAAEDYDLAKEIKDEIDQLRKEIEDKMKSLIIPGVSAEEEITLKPQIFTPESDKNLNSSLPGRDIVSISINSLIVRLQFEDVVLKNVQVATLQDLRGVLAIKDRRHDLKCYVLVNKSYTILDEELSALRNLLCYNDPTDSIIIKVDQITPNSTQEKVKGNREELEFEDKLPGFFLEEKLKEIVGDSMPVVLDDSATSVVTDRIKVENIENIPMMIMAPPGAGKTFTVQEASLLLFPEPNHGHIEIKCEGKVWKEWIKFDKTCVPPSVLSYALGGAIHCVVNADTVWFQRPRGIVKRFLEDASYRCVTSFCHDELNAFHCTSKSVPTDKGHWFERALCCELSLHKSPLHSIIAKKTGRNLVFNSNLCGKDFEYSPCIHRKTNFELQQNIFCVVDDPKYKGDRIVDVGYSIYDNDIKSYVKVFFECKDNADANTMYKDAHNYFSNRELNEIDTDVILVFLSRQPFLSHVPRQSTAVKSLPAAARDQMNSLIENNPQKYVVLEGQELYKSLLLMKMTGTHCDVKKLEENVNNWYINNNTPVKD